MKQPVLSLALAAMATTAAAHNCPNDLKAIDAALPKAKLDANALKILDQEIRDADTSQDKARDDLAGLVARRRMA